MNFFSSMGFTAVSFLAFTVLVAVIAYFYSRNRDMSSESGYYLAGRSLPGIVIAGSLIMTDLSASQLIGNNGQSVQVGMGVFAAQGFGFSGMILVALLLVPKYLQSGISTMPEFYELRYDKFTRNLTSIIMMISYIVVFLPSTLYAGAQVFITIFNVDGMLGISYTMAMTIICVIIAIIGFCYAFFGGLKAIAMSDTINGLGMLVGGIIITIAGMIYLSNILGGDGSFLDGLDKFLHTDPAMMNIINEADSNEPWWPWPVILTGLTVNNVYFWGCDQAIVQRAFGAKSMAHAQKGMIYAGLLTLITPFFLVLPGIIAKFVFTDMDWATSGDLAFPMLINAVLPKPVLGFFAACVFGAIISTFNSYLNSASSIFAINIYSDIIHPEADEKTVVKYGRLFSVVVAVCATAIAPFLANVNGIFSWMNMALGLFNTPILIITLFAIFSKRAPRYLGKIIIPIHIVIYLLLNYLLPHVIPFFGTIHYMYYTFVLFIFDVIVSLIVTKMNPLKEEYTLPNDPPKDMDLSPWKYRIHASVATLAIVAIIYVIFSPLGFGKCDETTWERYQNSMDRSAVTCVVDQSVL